jgi:hypothetical protein
VCEADSVLKFVGLLTAEAQKIKPDSSTGKSVTRPHHTIRRVLKKEYSEVTIEKCYEGQNFFL